MADTFSHIYIHIVFAVQNRKSLISPKWEETLYKYISGIINNKGQKLLAINGVSNHIHLFVGINASCSVSSLVREIKKSTSNYINENKLSEYPFRWQEGFGAFSYSRSHISNVIIYIEKQKAHHNKQTFKDEYIAFLKAFDIEFKNEYLFEWI